MADAAAGEPSSAGTAAGGTGNVKGGSGSVEGGVGGANVEGGVGGGSPGGGGNAGSVGEEPTERSVTGTVVALNEMPVPGAHVRIAGKDVVADEKGVFTATVGAAYDAAVFGNDDSTRQVSIYLGLTRSNPKLYVTPVPLIHGPQLSGVVTGQLPVSGTTKTGTRVYVTGPFMNEPFSAMSFSAEDDGTFQGYTPVWFGPDQVNGTLFALQFSWITLGPPALQRIGSKPIQITRDGTWNASDGALEVVDYPGYRFVPSDAWEFSEGSNCQLVLALEGYDQMEEESCSDAFGSGPPGFHVPSVPAALRHGLQAWGTINRHSWSLERSYAGDADEFPVTYPKGVPTAEGPEGAVSVAYSALWQLTPAPESIMSLRLTWSNDGEHVALVYTDEKKVSLARLFDAGLQLVPGETVEWAAQGHIEASSMDAYAAPGRWARDARSTIDADEVGSPAHGLTYDPPTVAP